MEIDGESKIVFADEYKLGYPSKRAVEFEVPASEIAGYVDIGR
jgi:hypothetical protein